MSLHSPLTHLNRRDANFLEFMIAYDISHYSRPIYNLNLVPGKGEVKTLYCQYDIKQFPADIEVVIEPLAESSKLCKMYPTEVIDVVVEFASARNDNKDGGTASLMAAARRNWIPGLLDIPERQPNEADSSDKRNKWLVVIDFAEEPDITGMTTLSLLRQILPPDVLERLTAARVDAN